MKKINDDDFVMGEIYTPDMQQSYLYESFCPTNEPFQVYISEESLKEIFYHSLRGHKQGQGEIAGALVGNVFQVFNSKIRYVEINASIAANTSSGRAHVEISAKEWFRINDVIEKDPRYRIRSTTVGWYHSHPGFSVFMSGTDENTQLSHFNLEWQVAIVVDPVNLDIGCFCTKNIKQQVPLYIIPRPTDTSVVKAAALLKSLNKADVATITPGNNNSTLLNEINKLSTQIDSLTNRQITFIEEIESHFVEQGRNNEQKSLEESFSQRLDHLHKSVNHQLEQTLPSIKDLNTKVQKVVNSFDALTNKLSSSESIGTDPIIINIKKDLETVRSNQESLEKLLSKMQNNVSQYEKEIQASQDTLLDKIKSKIDTLQNEQRQSIAGITNVQTEFKRIEQSAIELWQEAKRKIVWGGVVFLLITFIVGFAGAYTYENFVSENTPSAIQESPTQTRTQKPTPAPTQTPSATPRLTPTVTITPITETPTTGSEDN